ncbi:MAG: sugar phosphate isomerase/epimerase [Alphaproteobacteria bacterium]|nr:sugar phosphate isomerase/epimerase [Alphaproteobacteria bacterium]
MGNTRRQFTKSMLVLSAIPIIPKFLFSQNSKSIKIGLQLYSVRDAMFKDPLNTLKAIKTMGYTHIEHAHYDKGNMYGFTVKEFKKILDDNGLLMMSGHTYLGEKHIQKNTASFTSEWLKTIEDAAFLNQEFVISPGIDAIYLNDTSHFSFLMTMFNKAGEICQKYGMKFGYHNHYFEFQKKINDQLIWDYIVQHTEPSLVILQFDMGNPYAVIGNPNATIQKYAHRIVSMHVKDEIKNPDTKNNAEQYISTILGDGLIDTKAACFIGLQSGITKHFIVEQESYQGKLPLDCVHLDLTRINQFKLL